MLLPLLFTSGLLDGGFSGELEPPVADFTADVLTGVEPLTVQFTDQTTQSPSSWLWDFGDTNTSTSQNPEHTYTVPGVYNVTLTATNSVSADSTTKFGYIIVTSAPPVITPGGPLNFLRWFFRSRRRR